MHPLYPHDCDRCRYLGVTREGARTYDLYVCGNSVLARYGEAPEQNLASDLYADHGSAPIREARRRARPWPPQPGVDDHEQHDRSESP